MSVNRKRRAEDQLSPYTTEGETKNHSEKEVTKEDKKIRKRAKASIGSRGIGVSDPDSLKGLLTTINLIRPSVENDKISGLNRSFLEAVQKVVKTQSNKDLTFLIKQYEKYLSKIEK